MRPEAQGWAERLGFVLGAAAQGLLLGLLLALALGRLAAIQADARVFQYQGW